MIGKVNRLRRIIRMQEVYLQWKIHEGVMDMWIYREKIFPDYFIGYTTFLKYMQMNAKKKLTDLQELIQKEEEHESNRDQGLSETQV